MKNLFILMLIVSACIAFSCKKDNKTSAPLGYYRNTTWGIDSVQLKTLEKNKLIFDTTENSNVSSIKTITFSGDMSNQFYNYYLIDNVLHGGETFYDLNNMYDTGDPFIAEYNTIKGQLTSLYGQPVDQTTWYVTTDQNNTSQWGAALKNGDVEFRCFWNLQKSYIYLDMQTVVGTFNSVYISIDYFDKLFYTPLQALGSINPKHLSLSKKGLFKLN